MKHKYFIYSFFLLALSVNESPGYGFSSALSDVDGKYEEEYEDLSAVNDPIEDLNRSIFAFNQDFDKYLLNPLAEVYDEGLPEPIKDRVHSFLSNLNIPLIFVHDVLQAEGEQSIDSLARFLINSTLGLGGLFDPAAELFDLQPHTSDFGQTLGKYGVDEGAYIMIPI